MRSKPDQRIKEDLDLFLLALIQQGINTAYRMQIAAGISQGTSLQVLKRLVERKFVRMSVDVHRKRPDESGPTPSWRLGRTPLPGCGKLISPFENRQYGRAIFAAQANSGSREFEDRSQCAQMGGFGTISSGQARRLAPFHP
jgi:hypothetical protein